VAHDADLQVQVRLGTVVPAVENDAGTTRAVRSAASHVLGDRNVETPAPLPPSDDMSEFLGRVPGCFFFIGAAREDGASGMHHSPLFRPDEWAIGAGIRVLTRAAVDLAEPR
jgi:amidohydrolase